MKNRLTAIWRVMTSNEFFVVTQFGMNGLYIEGYGSKIAELNKKFAELNNIVKVESIRNEVVLKSDFKKFVEEK